MFHGTELQGLLSSDDRMERNLSVEIIMPNYKKDLVIYTFEIEAGYAMVVESVLAGN